MHGYGRYATSFRHILAEGEREQKNLVALFEGTHDSTQEIRGADTRSLLFYFNIDCFELFAA